MPRVRRLVGPTGRQGHGWVVPLLDPRLLPAVLALAIGVVFTIIVALLRRGLRRHRLRSRFARARVGEERAEEILRARGYEVLARQSPVTWRVRVGGECVDVDLRADYVVAKNGRTLVAEVKTGRLATSIESAATRRQLLEYRCAFAADGVLLVDAERESVNEVVFELPRAGARPARGATTVVVALAAALMAAAYAAYGRLSTVRDRRCT